MGSIPNCVPTPVGGPTVMRAWRIALLALALLVRGFTTTSRADSIAPDSAIGRARSRVRRLRSLRRERADDGRKSGGDGEYRIRGRRRCGRRHRHRRKPARGPTIARGDPQRHRPSRSVTSSTRTPIPITCSAMRHSAGRPIFVGHHNLPRALALRGSHYLEGFRRSMGTMLDGVELIAPQRRGGNRYDARPRQPRIKVARMGRGPLRQRSHRARRNHRDAVRRRPRFPRAYSGDRRELARLARSA